MPILLLLGGPDAPRGKRSGADAAWNARARIAARRARRVAGRAAGIKRGGRPGRASRDGVISRAAAWCHYDGNDRRGEWTQRVQDREPGRADEWRRHPRTGLRGGDRGRRRRADELGPHLCRGERGPDRGRPRPHGAVRAEGRPRGRDGVRTLPLHARGAPDGLRRDRRGHRPEPVLLDDRGRGASGAAVQLRDRARGSSRTGPRTSSPSTRCSSTSDRPDRDLRGGVPPDQAGGRRARLDAEPPVRAGDPQLPPAGQGLRADPEHLRRVREAPAARAYGPRAGVHARRGDGVPVPRGVRGRERDLPGPARRDAPRAR